MVYLGGIISHTGGPSFFHSPIKPHHIAPQHLVAGDGRRLLRCQGGGGIDGGPVHGEGGQSLPGALPVGVPGAEGPGEGTVAELLVHVDLFRRDEGHGTVGIEAPVVVPLGGAASLQAHSGEGQGQERGPEGDGLRRPVIGQRGPLETIPIIV